jgi:hypothetical protein
MVLIPRGQDGELTLEFGILSMWEVVSDGRRPVQTTKVAGEDTTSHIGSAVGSGR